MGFIINWDEIPIRIWVNQEEYGKILNTFLEQAQRKIHIPDEAEKEIDKIVGGYLPRGKIYTFELIK